MKMAHPKLILKRIQFHTIHLHTQRSNYALTISYEFWHYRSFWKVNKNTFFVKASYMRMEYQIEIRTKGLIRGHLKISKKSKNTSKESKLRKLCIGEVDLFLQNYQKSTMPKTSNFAKWAQSFSLVLSWQHSPRL